MAVDRHLLDAGAELLQDGGDAHHEELVEVGAGDGEELDALEQRMRRVLRLRQHALVERQPAQLAIDVQRRAAEVVRDRGSTSPAGRGAGAATASAARRLRGRRLTAAVGGRHRPISIYGCQTGPGRSKIGPRNRTVLRDDLEDSAPRIADDVELGVAVHAKRADQAELTGAAEHLGQLQQIDRAWLPGVRRARGRS